MKVYVCDMCHKIMEEPYGRVDIDFNELDSCVHEKHSMTMCKKCYKKYTKGMLSFLRNTKKLERKLLDKVSKKNVYLSGD